MNSLEKVIPPHRWGLAVFAGTVLVYLATGTWDWPLHIDTHASAFPA
jgi:hypothetical protein